MTEIVRRKPPNAGKGRVKGVPNKASKVREAIIAAAGVTPLEYLLSVMRDSQDVALRLEAAKAAAPYVHPRLANVELRATHTVSTELAEPVTLEQAEVKYLEMIHAVGNGTGVTLN